MTTLTKDIRDRAVDALRRAHAEGRKQAYGQHVNTDGGVCSCVVIAEEFDIAVPDLYFGVDEFYTAIEALGFEKRDEFASGVVLPIITKFNDHWIDGENPTFNQVADMVAALDVVEEAEAILREAALVPA